MKTQIIATMETYKFGSGSQIIEIDAANYNEALAALIFQVGSEAETAKFIFIG